MGDTGDPREIQEIQGRYRRSKGDTGDPREIPRNPKETGRYGSASPNFQWFLPWVKVSGDLPKWPTGTRDSRRNRHLW
jgi:hypothetical protein